jgi:uncharacterized protein (TIGR03067 family)
MISEDALTPLQGRWRVLAVEYNGERDDWPPSEAPTVLIRDDWYIDEFAEPRISYTQFRLEPAGHAMDFFIAPGIVIPGIYSLVGTRLLICCNMLPLFFPEQSQRVSAPTSFTTIGGSGSRLWVLERASGPDGERDELLDAHPGISLGAVRQALANIPGTLAQLVDEECEER